MGGGERGVGVRGTLYDRLLRFYSNADIVTKKSKKDVQLASNACFRLSSIKDRPFK